MGIRLPLLEPRMRVPLRIAEAVLAPATKKWNR